MRYAILLLGLFALLSPSYIESGPVVAESVLFKPIPPPAADQWQAWIDEGIWQAAQEKRTWFFFKVEKADQWAILKAFVLPRYVTKGFVVTADETKQTVLIEWALPA